MSCGNPEHDELEHDLQAALQDVLRLEEELHDAKARPAAGGGGLGDVALEDLERVIEENANLTREKEKFQQDWLNQRDRANDLETQLEERQDRLRESERLRKRLEEDLESARTNLAAEKAKAAAATRKVGDADRSKRTGQREQIQVMQELQELRTHCDAVEAQLAERDGLIQELSEANQQLTEQLDELTVQKEGLQHDLKEKKEDLQAVQRDFADATDQLAVARETEEDTEQRIAAAVAAAAAADAAAARAAAAAAKELASAKEEVKALRDGSAVAERAKEAAALASKLQEMTAELALRGEALEQADADLEQLSARLEQAERRAAAAETAAAAAGAGGSRGGVAGAADPRAAQRLTALEERLKEEAERRGETERRKDEAERRLEEAEAWKAKYEAGHGLEEATRHSKQQQRDIKRLQQELEGRGQLLGEALDAKEVLLLVCERLKRDAGKPPDFSYADIPALRAEHQSEVERLRAVQSEMSEQMAEMEEERLHLLQRLRDNAAAISEKGLRLVGLDAAQLEKVSEFARSLRDGTVTLPVDKRSAELKRELREAREECRRKDALVERLDHDLAAAERRIAAAEASAAASAAAGAFEGPGAADQSGVSEGGGKAADSSVIPELTKLREELSSLVKDGFSKLQQPPPAAASSPKKKSPVKAAKATAAGAGAADKGLQEDPLFEGPTGGDEDINPASGAANVSDDDDETPRRGGKRARIGGGKGGAVAGSGAEGASGVIQRRQQAALVKAADETLQQLQKACVRLEAANKAQATAAAEAAKTAGGKAVEAAATAEAQRLAGEVARLQLLLAALVPVPAAAAGHAPASGSGIGASGSGGGGVGLPAGGVAATGLAALFVGHGPKTAGGQEALSKELRRLRLPPEEWADEVRALHSRLAEALEQLGEREQELDEYEELVKRYESQLSHMRAQVATLYKSHAEGEAAAAAKQKELLQQVSLLSEQRDGLQTRLKHATAVLDAEDAAAEDPSAPHRALREASRKLVVYEVNEAVLARRYTSLAEQLRLETEARAAAERDAIDAEAAGRSRILFLEQWKAGASQRLDRLQKELEESVPLSQLADAERELKALRGDYLFLLERETEARVSLVQQNDTPKRLRAAEYKVAELKAQLGEAQEARAQSEAALAQRDRLLHSVTATSSTAEFSQLMDEVAKAQGEAARATSERAALQVRLDYTVKRLDAVEQESTSQREQLDSTGLRLRQTRRELEECKKELLTVQSRFADGLPSSEAAALRHKMTELEEQRAALAREAERCRELADVASSQATAVATLRQAGAEELQELRRHVSELESRGDDDIIIGRLQRRLMALKMTYRAFARKHEATRANLRRKAVAARLLEGRLDKREEAMHELQESSRRKVSALKKALMELADRGLLPGEDADARLLGLAAARDMAARVRFLEGRLKDAEAATADAAKAAAAETAAAEAAIEERKSLERQVLDLRSALEHLSPAAASPGGSGAADGVAAAAAGREVARRLVALSEEVRAAKLEGLEAKRQLQLAREEKRHLEGVAASASDNVRRLEEACAEAEARSLLGLGPAGARGPTSAAAAAYSSKSADGTADAVSIALALGLGPGEGAGMVLLSPRGGFGASHASNGFGFGGGTGMTEEERRLLATAMAPAEGELGVLGPEDALERLRAASRRVTALLKELSEAKLERARLRERADVLEHVVEDKSRQVHYYERLAKENNLPLLQASASNGHADGAASSDEESVTDDGAGGAGRGSTASRMRRSERRRGQKQLQEAAALTIGSLKKMIEDKNATIERYKQKLEKARDAQRRHAAAERHEVARLTDKAYRDNVDALEQLRLAVRQLHGSPGLDGAGAALSGRLMEQLEDFAAMVGERDQAAREMELRLRTALNQKERAEARCGEAMQEVESLRGDVATLANQLQDSEERVLRLTEDGGPNGKRVAELRRTLLSKESKLRALRAAVVSLKQEFVLSEERREQAALAGERQRGRRVEDRAVELTSTATALRGQVEELEKGLAEAKDDAAKHRNVATRYRREVEDLQKEKAKLSSKVEAAATQAAEAAKVLTRARRERDDAREAEQRAREKLRTLRHSHTTGGSADQKEGEGKDDEEAKEGDNVSGGGRGGEAAARRIAELMRRVQVLTAQNAALRSAIVPSGRDVVTGSSAAAAGAAEAGEGGGGAGAGRRLGTAEEARAAAARPPGEEERRLRKRVDTLEKRLTEKNAELQAAERQAAQARELLSRAAKEKELLQRRLDAAGGKRPTSSTGESAAAAGGAAAVSAEAARARVFELEEENAGLRRQAEVRLPREVEALKHEVRALRGQLETLDAELEREQRAHAAAVAQLRRAAVGEGGSGLLRAEEEWFHEKEAMRDELAAARSARRDLERALLDRDADAMEMRFEMEAATAEAERLRRRLGEVQALAEASDKAAGGSGIGGKARVVGGRFKRERDLEGVVDALKRVVEKLRSENERLRRGAADGARVSEVERKLRDAKQQLAEAQKEAEALKARALSGEEAVQRLAQKQEAVNQARRQARGKEEELRVAKQQLQAAESAKAALAAELEQANRALAAEQAVAQQSLRGQHALRRTGDASAEEGAASAAMRQEVAQLRDRLAEAERELARAARRSDLATSRSSAGGGGTSGATAADVAALEDEVEALRRENERLNGELQAFDLDFFEEIEDLKYKYSLAVKKLKQYEGGGRELTRSRD